MTDQTKTQYTRRFAVVATHADGRKETMWSWNTFGPKCAEAVYRYSRYGFKYAEVVDTKLGVTLETWHNGRRTFRREAA